MRINSLQSAWHHVRKKQWRKNCLKNEGMGWCIIGEGTETVYVNVRKEESTEITLLEETSLSKQCFPKPVQAVFCNSSHWKEQEENLVVSKTYQIEVAQNWLLVWVSKGMFSMNYCHSHITATVEDALPEHILVLEHKWLCRTSLKEHGNERKCSFDLYDLSAFHSCSPLLLVPLAILLYHLRFHFMKLNHVWQKGLKLIIVVSFPILKIKMALSLAEHIGSLPAPPKDTKNNIFPCSALSCLQMLFLHLTWS